MGVDGRVSISSCLSGVPEPAGKCIARPGWLPWPRHGSFVGRLLPTAFDEFATPDLVGSHGGQPVAARLVWVIGRRECSLAEFRAARARGLGVIRDQERACRIMCAGSQV